MSNISFSNLDSNSTVIPQFQNGRVINFTGPPVKDFKMFTANNNTNDSFKSMALKHIQVQTKLSLEALLCAPSIYNTPKILIVRSLNRFKN